MASTTAPYVIEHGYVETPEMDGCLCGWVGYNLVGHVEFIVRDQVARDIEAREAESRALAIDEQRHGRSDNADALFSLTAAWKTAAQIARGK